MIKFRTSKIIPAIDGDYNLKDYDKTYSSFRWEDVERNFSWYHTGKVNIAYECIDRHAETKRKDKIALIYESEDREEQYSFRDLKILSNKFGNILKNLGVKRGDRVFLFLPRCPELYISFLGTIKIGAIAGPLFEGLMEGALKDRLQDSDPSIIITTPQLKERIPINDIPTLSKIIVVGARGKLKEHEISFEKEMAKASSQIHLEWLQREDGMVLHYTSMSTGKPKGILHSHNAMVQLYQTAKWVLDLRDEDIYWCTADPGWITGTSYGIFAPWLHGITNVVLGGRFNLKKWYRTIEKYGITVWYSTPTAFRMLMAADERLFEEVNLSSLRHILSVGEPLNPEVVYWGLQYLERRIHDTWWMTETGGQIICNFPCLPIKPGSMGKPFPGVLAAILDKQGNELPPYEVGQLAIKVGWPSMMQGIWKNDSKYREYFVHDGWFYSGDLAYVDEDGYFWFAGRHDDLINTSGERVGPFEVESKLIDHPAVAEAGVIGKPDPLRGEIIKAFIVLKSEYLPSDKLKEDIIQFVKKGLAAHAAPREIEFKAELPKTRSGKIMRRILKAWEVGLPIGDISTINN